MSDVMQKIVLQADTSQFNSDIRKAKSAVDEFGKSVEKASGQRMGGTGGAAADPFAAATSAPARDADIERAKKDHSEQMGKASEREDKHQKIFGRFLQTGAQGAAGMVGQLSGGNMFGAVAQGMGTAGAQAGMMGSALGGAAVAAGAALAIGAIAIKVANNLADKEYARIAPLFTTGLAQRLGVKDFPGLVSAYYWQGLKTGMPEEMTMRMLAGYSAGGGTIQANKVTGFRGEGAGFSGAAGAALQLAGRASLNLGVESQTLGGYLGLLSRLGVNMTGGAANNQFYAQGLNSFGISSLGRFVELSTALVKDMESRMRSSDITTSMITGSQGRLAALGAFGGFTVEGAANIEQRTRAQRLASSNLGRPEDVLSFMINRTPGEDIVDTMIRMRNPQSDTKMYNFIKQTTPPQLLRARVMQYFGIEPESVDGFIATQEGISKGTAITGAYTGVPNLGRSYEGALVGVQTKQWDVMGLPEKWMQDLRTDTLRKALYGTTGIDLIGDLTATSKGAAAGMKGSAAQRADAEAIFRKSLAERGYTPSQIEAELTKANLAAAGEARSMTSGEQLQLKYLEEMTRILTEILSQGKDPKKTSTDQRPGS